MIGHLLWSTATALIAFGVAWLLRNRSASIRFTILFLALMRFAIPTPWLTASGSSLATLLPARPLVRFVEDVSPYLRGPGMVAPSKAPVSAPVGSSSPMLYLALVWALGTGLILAFYARRARTPMPAIREATPLEREALWRASDRLGIRQRADLRIVSAQFAPGAIGIRRPGVVLPDGLSDYLTDSELQSVLAHELAHIQRRDNLTASFARGVTAIFWFHPLALLLLRQLFIERETACDEFVLTHGAERDHYLSGIAKVCERAISYSHVYAGITGSNLKNRLEHIMTLNHRIPTSARLRALPVALGGIALLIPIGGGFLKAQQASATQAAEPEFAQTVTPGSKGGALVTESKEDFQQVPNHPPSSGGAVNPQQPTQPEAMESLVGRIERLMSQHQADAAIAELQRAIQQEPVRKDLRVALANIYVRSERYSDAVALYQTLILEDPTDASLHFKLGETYRRMGQLDKGADEFQRAAYLAPNDTGALLQQALILDGTGHQAEAAAVYARIIGIDAKHGIALNNLSYLESEDNPSEALAHAKRAAAVLPNSSDVADTLGWAYLKNNQPDQALTHFRDALELDFDRASIQGHFKDALDKASNPTPEMKELTILIRADVTAARDARIRELLSKLP